MVNNDRQGDGAMAFGKSNAKVSIQAQSGKTFADVAGQDEAKEALLHEPQKYAQTGAACPKGALAVGPPGAGKTLLAQAAAGEANPASRTAPDTSGTLEADRRTCPYLKNHAGGTINLMVLFLLSWMKKLGTALSGCARQRAVRKTEGAAPPLDRASLLRRLDLRTKYISL